MMNATDANRLGGHWRLQQSSRSMDAEIHRRSHLLGITSQILNADHPFPVQYLNLLQKPIIQYIGSNLEGRVNTWGGQHIPSYLIKALPYVTVDPNPNPNPNSNQVTVDSPRSDAITVISANFAWEVDGYTGKKHEKVEYLINNANKADAIFLQESPKKTILETRLSETPYEVVVNFATSKWERWGIISVLRRRDSPWSLIDTKITDTNVDATPCYTHRKNVIVTLQHEATNKQMRIGCAHLCGGGPDEEWHQQDCTELITNIKTYTIQKMIDQGSDIILGDFSVPVLKRNLKILLNYRGCGSDWGATVGS